MPAEAGADELVIKRDPTTSGATAMSNGLIPAAGSRAQRAAGVTDDTPALFAADQLAKNKRGSPAALTR